MDSIMCDFEWLVGRSKESPISYGQHGDDAVVGITDRQLKALMSDSPVCEFCLTFCPCQSARFAIRWKWRSAKTRFEYTEVEKRKVLSESDRLDRTCGVNGELKSKKNLWYSRSIQRMRKCKCERQEEQQNGEESHCRRVDV
jgi:hypothetical protein